MQLTVHAEKLKEIIKKFNSVEAFDIGNCKVDGISMSLILSALRSSISTMKSMKFQGSLGNTEEVITELVNYVADAPKIENCDI